MFKTMYRVFGYMQPLRRKYFAGVSLSAFELIILLSVPFVNRMLVEMIIGDSQQTLLHVIMIMVGLLALTPFVVIGRLWLSTCAQKCADNLKKALFSHIQRMRLVDFRQQGDLIVRVTTDAERAGNMFQGFAVISVIRFIVITAVTMTLLVIADWRIAVLALVYNIICFVISILLNPYISRLERGSMKEMSKASNVILETIRGLPVVRVFAIGATLRAVFDKRIESARQKRSFFRAANGAVYGIIDIFTFSSQAVGFIVAIFLLARGEMRLDIAVYTASLMALASDAMLRLSTFILHIQTPLVNASRVFEILDEPTEEQVNEVNNCEGDIAIDIKALSFTYPDGNTALNNINLSIKHGEHVAFVGASGGGKTTLAMIIAGLYEPSIGEVCFFGKKGSARELIAYVPQEPALFDGTVYDNINLGRLSATENEIIKVAKDVDIEEILYSQVGERGTQISGGQRQTAAKSCNSKGNA